MLGAPNIPLSRFQRGCASGSKLAQRIKFEMDRGGVTHVTNRLQIVKGKSELLDQPESG